MKSVIQSSLEDGKAQDVVTIDLHGKTDIADCMIIATGTSAKHASVLADKLIKKIKDVDPYAISSTEGLTEGNWVIVDTGDVIIHIFKAEYREIYNLEKMWAVTMPEAAELALV